MLVWARDPESGVEDDVPDGKVRLPKLGRPVKDILSREEVERLEDTARTERDKLIIRVFGDTGMRVGELVRLRTEDLATRQRKNFLRVSRQGRPRPACTESSIRLSGGASNVLCGGGRQPYRAIACSLG